MTDGPGPRTRWAGADYAGASEHHRRVDAWFLDRHPPRPADVVVDLGCGSGEFTAQLAGLVPHGQVVGVDQDASMLEQAAGRAGTNLRFVRSPAERVDEVVDHGSVDLVVSRAMLHWLPHHLHPQLFRAVARVLRPGGWFHCEAGGAGNVPHLMALLTDVAARGGLPGPPPFPDTGVVLEQLEVAGFEVPEDGVRTVAQRRAFDRAAVEGFLRTQGSLVLTRHVPADRVAGVLDECLQSIETMRRHDGSYDQTFVRLDLLVRRPADSRPADR